MAKLHRNTVIGSRRFDEDTFFVSIEGFHRKFIAAISLVGSNNGKR